MRRPEKLFAVLLVLALTLASANVRAQTWRFVVCGDTRGTSSTDQINTTIVGEIARAVTNHHPAFLLVPGDLGYAGSLAVFQSWTNTMTPLYKAGIPIYPVAGNHDLTGIASWSTVFGSLIPNNGPPSEIDRTYAIVCANALILCLDTYSNTGRVNQTWIDAVLATNTCPHVFAQGHMPAFKANHTDCLDDYQANRNAFWTSLSNAHARIYFAGHDHFYSHTRIDDGDGNPANDLHQMIVGTGGAPITTTYAYDGANAPYTPQVIYHEQQYGYLVVDINGYNVSTTWYHRTAANTYVATAEVFNYTVPATRPLITFTVTNKSLLLTWPNGGTLQSAEFSAGPFTPITGAASPYTVTNLPGSARFYRVSVP